MDDLTKEETLSGEIDFDKDGKPDIAWKLDLKMNYKGYLLFLAAGGIATWIITTFF